MHYLHQVITLIYEAEKHFHAIIEDELTSQKMSQGLLTMQKIDIRQLGDLGNKWSRIRWWSILDKAGQHVLEHVVLQW